MSHMGGNGTKSDYESQLLGLLRQDREATDVVCDIRDLIAKATKAQSVHIFQLEPRLNRLYLWSEEGPNTFTEKLHRQDPLVVLAEHLRLQ